MSESRFTPSPVLGEVIVDQLIRLNVKDAVISPGSRNAPLTMALWRATNRSSIRLHTRIDERSAAFLALGIAKATGVPAPVICTSGSAAANFFPALLEAYHGGHPLVAITADRPARLWDTGANQTTKQVGMFSGANISTLNLAAVGDQPGQAQQWRAAVARKVLPHKPAHINVEFDEPLIGSLEWYEDFDTDVDIPPVKEIRAKKLAGYRQHGVIVVGHDAGGILFSSILEFSKRTGWPILSENPLLGSEVIPHASLILGDANRQELLRPDLVMTIGRLTLSRAINSYVSSASYQVVVDPRIEEIDTKRHADEIHFTLPIIENEVTTDPTWYQRFIGLSEKVGAKLPELLTEWSEPLAVKRIIEELPSDSTLFLSSSRPIRDVEAFASSRSGIEVHANRGLAGIDGNLSTALGIALCRERTYAIVGDLAFLHDINGLLIGPEEVRPNLTIVVISNEGGGIFSTLPQSDVLGFEKIFGTPHGRDLVKISESYGIDAIGVRTPDALASQLARRTNGIRVIVCEMPDRQSNAQLLKKINESLTLL